MKKIIQIVFLFCAFITFTKSNAQNSGIPKLEIQSKEYKNSVALESMQINVEIFGNLAKTTSTLVFKNNSNRVLEGNLTFPLPENTTVSSYAIDINGKLRNAVPVPKERATEVFESIQKRNVDPGIIEKVEGNNFKTRISPIPANGIRTIQIAYYQELNLENNNYQYHLPLDSSEKIGKFDLTVKVFQASEKPKLIESPDRTFTFSENSNVYEASLSKTDFSISKSLTIQLPKAENKIEAFTQKNTDGSMYFYANTIINSKSEPKIWSNNLGIIWDNSLSGLKRNHTKELELLGKIIQQQNNLTIEVVLLNIQLEKGKTFQIKNGEWSELKNYLEKTVYDGATNYAVINPSKLTANEYLMFSDGISTFGPNQFKSNKPIYTIGSAATSNFGVLNNIAQKNLGKFINLSEMSVEKAYQKINENNLQFIGVKDKNITEVYPPIGTEIEKEFAVTGICPSSLNTIILEFGRNGKVLFTKEIDLKNASKTFEISKVWAQNKVNYLEQNPDENKEDILEIGNQFGIVTSNTSLIVLEDVYDYVRYKINPPDELKVEYDQIVKNNRDNIANENKNLVDAAIQTTEDLKKWWNTDYSKNKKKYPVPAKEIGPTGNQALRMMAVQNEAPQADMIAAVEAAEEQASSSSQVARTVQNESVATMDAVVMESAGSSDRKKESKPNRNYVPEIKTFDIKSDKDYVKLIETSKSPYETYLELRETYQETPSFYYDVATYFIQQKDKETGTKILSSIAELGLENAELYKLLAYKLKELEMYETELFIAEKVLKSRPFDAQSHRDYALALQDNKRYQEALGHLYQTITNSYDAEFSRRNKNISEILIPEINNLISLYGNNLDLSKIDKRMIADIPVDIRVVINWNKDNTDIDLWIEDPNGETCYYGSPTTQIGGRMSNDITQGFGPEQFMLKKAVKGKYKIKTNFFGENQMSLSGPTTISAEIYLMYSSGKEIRSLITFQNNKPDRGDDKILIGEFEF
ncbi:hypothetical protein EG240_05580 [Paenimyroides tangerinum]|uniref:VIT domain-containing protein n=1 Tax=Paenimyroides tangerinum TaxID=2488728 RepID=A0A3P3W9J4_9FLAO|nr:VIT domain-containing protein [Paenimyroides tangerinum]RRJ91670.1 hypothetical protein EG240_05580 [Paenimyroides tangerinum]